MSEILSSLGPFQWGMILFAAILVGPIIFEKIFGLNVETPKPIEDKDESLVEVIECWESLKSKCEKHGLAQASEEIHKVFPLFAKSKDVL